MQGTVLVTDRTHNPEYAGSIPAPAPKLDLEKRMDFEPLERFACVVIFIAVVTIFGAGMICGAYLF